MNKNKYLLLWSSVGVLLLLVLAAVDENFLKDWRRIQGATRSADGPIEVRLRQVINPTLKISDRCVSCHVGMAPGEQGVTGPAVVAAHPPVVHDPTEFGCTTCHGGQGLATEQADAHGDVHFWPEPMLPGRYSYAGCGTCHAPTGIPNAASLEKAQSTFERLDCLACHRVNGRGGTQRPGGGGMEGPDLSRVGVTGYRQDWYQLHVQKNQQAADGPWKTSFGQINEADLTAIQMYLATRVGAPKLIEAKATFLSLGCMGCHKVSGIGGDAGVDLSRSGERDPGQLNFTHIPGQPTFANWLAEHFRSPIGIVPGSQMPMMRLSEAQIDQLTMYVLSLRRRELPGTYLPKDQVRVLRFSEREFARDGATMYSALCSACHGAKGQGVRYPGLPPFPGITNPDFINLVSDEFLTATITSGRPGRKMPAWGGSGTALNPEEIKAIVGYLRQVSATTPVAETTPPRWVKGNPVQGEKLFAANCSGCHGTKGEGNEGPALNNQILLNSATDRFLVETITQGRRGTVMPGFSQSSTVRPALTPAEIESIVTFMRSWEGKKR
ncbi:MAG TPA: c-type cytochrome [Acidobacteriota bacterium]|nr:c-type cytochrome [Acidobacteriota bacterium]